MSETSKPTISLFTTDPVQEDWISDRAFVAILVVSVSVWLLIGSLGVYAVWGLLT